MAWKTGPNTQLGLAAGNPAIVDSVIGGIGGSVNGLNAMPAGYAITQVGQIAMFFEDTLGPAELIYLPGVAGLVAGDLVEYDLTPGAIATIRHSNATASNSGRPLAVAIGAPQAGQWGWFQISGVAIVNATAASAAGACYATATAGSVNSTADAGDQIMNARLSTAVGTPAAGKAYLTLNRPSVQGQIT